MEWFALHYFAVIYCSFDRRILNAYNIGKQTSSNDSLVLPTLFLKLQNVFCGAWRDAKSIYPQNLQSMKMPYTQYCEKWPFKLEATHAVITKKWSISVASRFCCRSFPRWAGRGLKPWTWRRDEEGWGVARGEVYYLGGKSMTKVISSEGNRCLRWSRSD